MKNLSTIFIAVFLLLLSFAKAQSTQNWQPVLNNYDGTNLNEGVEATCLLSQCNNNDVLIFKLVNSTNKKFKATWYLTIQTKDGNKHTGNNAQYTLILKPNSDNVGDCSGSVKELIIKLSDYGVTKDNYEYLMANGFNLNIIE